MPKREQYYDYVDLPSKKPGVVIETLTRKLYAPDGSIFYMPFGGDPAVYTAGKGYKAKPDAEWRAKNEEYERAQAESLRISNAQREIKLKEQELARRAEEKRMREEIDRVEAELAKREAELNGELEPEPEPEPVKAKAKPKAKAKAKA